MPASERAKSNRRFAKRRRTSCPGRRASRESGSARDRQLQLLPRKAARSAAAASIGGATSAHTRRHGDLHDHFATPQGTPPETDVGLGDDHATDEQVLTWRMWMSVRLRKVDRRDSSKSTRRRAASAARPAPGSAEVRRGRTTAPPPRHDMQPSWSLMTSRASLHWPMVSEDQRAKSWMLAGP